MIEEQYLPVYRHSLAHILAKAVQKFFGDETVQLAIGPQIDNGFYYDFGLPHPITEADFPALEKLMTEIIKKGEPFTRKEVSKDEALAIFKDQKYKVDIINELPADELITIYTTGDDFTDLCRGPHVANTKDVQSAAFKIASTSSAYWRGDEHNDSLQRIYVYAYPSKGELKEYLDFLAEAKARDHRILGPQLDLFFIDQMAPGMPYWLPKGMRLINTILDFWRDEHETRGYQEVATPLLNKNALWVTSGHWDHYRDGMFCMETEEKDIYGLKPMNCPNSLVIYNRKRHSYKEFPLRYSDCDVLHRKEKSGELNGLLRVQMFRQDDSHNYVTEDQIAEEVNNILDIADRFYGIFGMTYRPELSTRPDDYMGELSLWDRAEAELKSILDKRYGEGGYDINEGDGAFYGPKIDIIMKDCLGRQWQTGTVQLDFQLPRNFKAVYVAADNTEKIPVIIHRVIYGSLERFIGLLIEQFKGAFPFWLAPSQVGIVPIRAEHNEYAKEVARKLRRNHVHIEIDLDDSHMNNKIKNYKNYKVPYIVVLGDKEVTERTVSINFRDGGQAHDIPLDDFIKMCNYMNEAKCLDLIKSVDEIKPIED